VRSAGRRSRLFVDTGAFGAIVNPSDAHHGRARALTDTLLMRGVRLVTSNFVLAETHALVLARAGQRTALRAIELIEQSSAVFRVEPEDEQRAKGLLARYDDKAFSYTDATSFVMMQRLGIGEAFTFDRHFLQYGLAVFGLSEEGG
jgi:predicted nucleic acid-binding protein